MNQGFIKIFVNLVCITLMAYFGVQSFYSLVDGNLPDSDSGKGKSAGKIFARPDNAGSEKKAESFSAYSVIVERNLFKSASKSEADKKIDVENLKDTALNLKLWGTILSDGSDSRAIIEDSSSKSQQLYKIGDKIKNSTLKMILREKVVLSVDGADEILQMEKSDKKSASSSRIASSGRNSQRYDMPPRHDEKEIPIDRSEVESAMGDVSNIMRQISVKPHITDGKPDGIAVSSVQPNSIFRKAGLQSGDVIMSVDGREIKTFEDAMGMYESLKSSNRIEMQVKRGDTPVSLVYNINE